MNSGTTDLDTARADAGALLQHYWQAAEFDTTEELADDEAEVRAAYADLLAADPGDPTAASCLSLLELGRLRAHLNDQLGVAEDHFDHEHTPPAGLDEDDEAGRELAAEAVRAAERALARQPSDNLAAFARACALHWLGEPDAAVAAYREALRLDPYDRVARVRVEQLAGTGLPEPEPGLPTHHLYGFHLLEMTRLVGHSGSTKGWVWLLGDAASVRRAADGYLDGWLAGRGQGLSEEFGVWSQVPGAGRQGFALDEAVGRTAEGRAFLDWARVPLPGLGPDPLPAGRPVRWLGELHFFGGTEHDD